MSDNLLNLKLTKPQNDGRVSPFSCGSQWVDWQNSNCCQCSRVDWTDPNDPKTECNLFDALSYASVDDGRISPELAARLGVDPKHYVWPCLERKR